MLVIVGSVIVLVSVLGGFVMAGGPIPVLIQPSELVIIGGAALGSMITATPIPILKGMAAQFGSFFGARPSKKDYLELLGMLYQLFKLTQQSGVMALETHVEDASKSPIMSRYPKFLKNHHAVHFLTDSIKVIILGGIAPHDLEALMDEDLEVHHHEALKPSAALTTMGDSLPGLGIVAAVLGIVDHHAVDRRSGRGRSGTTSRPPSSGTFLGILLCYGFVGPMATQHGAHRQRGVALPGLREDGVAGGVQGLPSGHRRRVRAESAPGRRATELRRDREVLQDRPARLQRSRPRPRSDRRGERL